MRRDRGYLYPEWELVAREAPEFVTAYNELYRQALAQDARLPVKYRELVALGILAFRGEPDGLVNHIRRAFEHGATRDEVLGAIEATIIPGGALTFLNGLRALARVDAEPPRRKTTSRARRPEGRGPSAPRSDARPDGGSRDGDL
jgi:alkylhydroperoxidase/carboxymuconolactone decarboxylase family protein YurZ